jgi:hypothetical protein
LIQDFAGILRLHRSGEAKEEQDKRPSEQT